MKIGLVLAALAFAALPGVAVAMCQGDSHQTSASTCAEGLTWDPQTQTCVDATA